MVIPGLSEVVSRGEAEYFALARHPSLVAALRSFGLKETPEALHVVAPTEAEEVLSHLLARGMAYGEERLAAPEASDLARTFVSAHVGPTTRFLANGNLAAQQGWNPMTGHTFDSGIVVDNGRGEYACIWFTDED